jgi:putative addiction module component (TIGR02574 family)
MSEAYTRALAAVLELPPEERAAIKDAVEQSLDEQVDPEWVAELNRRRQGYLSGERPGIPAEEVYRQLRAEFGKPA